MKRTNEVKENKIYLYDIHAMYDDLIEAVHSETNRKSEQSVGART